MKEETIRLRVDVETKEAAQAAAQAQGRTLSNYILYLIQQDLKAHHQE